MGNIELWRAGIHWALTFFTLRTFLPHFENTCFKVNGNKLNSLCHYWREP